MIAPVKQRLLKILLADDGSLKMNPAVQMLADLPHGSDTTITALRVFTPLEGSEFARVETEVERTKSLLESRNLHFQSQIILGYPSETIHQYASENQPDLIVMGGKAAGRLDGLLGNVASSVVHNGRWPVLIVREPYHGLKRVLLVTDGSAASRHTCDYLGAFPLPAETSIDILYVVTPVRATYPVEPAGLALPIITADEEARINAENSQHGQFLLEKTRQELGEANPVNLVIKMGDPIEEIISYIKSEKIDLLVCGSRGTGNLTGWLLGSISRELVQQAPCSVMVVRTPPEDARA